MRASWSIESGSSNEVSTYGQGIEKEISMLSFKHCPTLSRTLLGENKEADNLPLGHKILFRLAHRLREYHLPDFAFRFHGMKSTPDA